MSLNWIWENTQESCNLDAEPWVSDTIIAAIGPVLAVLLALVSYAEYERKTQNGCKK